MQKILTQCNNQNHLQARFGPNYELRTPASEKYRPSEGGL